MASDGKLLIDGDGKILRAAAGELVLFNYIWDDCYVYQNSPTLPANNTVQMRVSNYVSGIPTEILIRHHLMGAAGTLSLYCSDLTGPGGEGVDMDVHLNLATFVENSVNWNTAPAYGAADISGQAIALGWNHFVLSGGSHGYRLISGNPAERGTAKFHTSEYGTPSLRPIWTPA